MACSHQATGLSLHKLKVSSLQLISLNLCLQAQLDRYSIDRDIYKFLIHGMSIDHVRSAASLVMVEHD